MTALFLAVTLCVSGCGSSGESSLNYRPQMQTGTVVASGGAYSLDYLSQDICVIPKNKNIAGRTIKIIKKQTSTVAHVRDILHFCSFKVSGSKRYASKMPATKGISTERNRYSKKKNTKKMTNHIYGLT